MLIAPPATVKYLKYLKLLFKKPNFNKISNENGTPLNEVIL